MVAPKMTAMAAVTVLVDQRAWQGLTLVYREDVAWALVVTLRQVQMTVVLLHRCHHHQNPKGQDPHIVTKKVFYAFIPTRVLCCSASVFFFLHYFAISSPQEENNAIKTSKKK
jgi:hypothetical protein